MTIFVDDRTGSKELAEVHHIRSRVELTRLEYADAFFWGNGPEGMPVPIGIERKTILDLVNSMDSGRLGGHQLRGLASHYSHVYLLVEGLWKPDRDGVLCRWVKGGWKPVEMGSRRYMARELERYLNSLMVMGGVHLWRTAGLEESGRWIGEMYGWWSKDWDKHRAVGGGNGAGRSPVGVPMKRPSLVWRVTKELDGVGWEKGRAVADRFGSILDLALADSRDLQKVPGVGKKIAEGIVKQIKGEG
mgnify:CR=1 FL=1